MPAKLGILFLGMTAGGATFLVAGFVCSLIIAQIQYSTLETRVARAVVAANQVSARAKDASILSNGKEAQARYELVSNAP
jgi:hypothetical protein